MAKAKSGFVIMKTLFPGYYRPTEEEFKALWQNCIFVFDTNVFLDLYRLSTKSANDLIRMLEKIQDSIWMPYQVAVEYHRNLYVEISTQSQKYDAALKQIDDLKKKIADKRNHPFLPQNENKEFENYCEKLKDQMRKQQEEVGRLLLDNELKDRLSSILNGSVGAKILEEDLEKYYEEGERRYKKHIPPGYCDVKKDNPYGDYIIWREMMEYAKDKKKDIIFVTSDVKDDWFLRIDGKTIGARPELIGEFKDKTKQSIYLYQFDRFIEYLKEHKQLEIEEDTVIEVQEHQLRKEQEKTESAIVYSSEGGIADSVTSSSVNTIDAIEPSQCNSIVS